MQTLLTRRGPLRLHPIISSGSSENGRILIFREKPIGLIKWRKAGFDNLLVSPYLKRRIKGRAIRDYRRGEHQNPPYSFNVAPTNPQW
jgi:hypothetical protein